MLGALAQGLARAGRIAEALGTVDEALVKSERDEERWWIGDLLRIKAELVAGAGDPRASLAAEGHWRDGLEWTRRQGALSLELRCAMGLARLWHGRGRIDEARDLLVPIYGRFTEAFGTADLRAAKALLDTLA